MIEKILDIAFAGFWEFCGMLILIESVFFLLARLFNNMWSRFMRMLMVRKHGWPPDHLDADGDWKPEPKAKE